MDILDLALVAAAFALGGLLKGATGAGAPLLAVPVMAALRDLPFAVAVFVLPNILPNILQGWSYRRAAVPPRLVVVFAAAGGLGAALGTVALARTDQSLLELVIAAALGVYILFRLLRPAWILSQRQSAALAPPVGLLAGMLQGAIGISAPVSITFLNAAGLAREGFILTISVFFVTLGLVQLPAQMAFGIMTAERALFSLLALLPLLAAMPAGAWIGRRLPPRAFDRLILAVLALLALRMAAEGLGELLGARGA